MAGLKTPDEIAALAARVRNGERAALGRAITLIESRRADHQAAGQALLQDLLADTGKAWRIGITGVPGAGKSTTIGTLGNKLVSAGHRLAVLAVDPTSQRTGGSILGDKTRMSDLAVQSQACIRPSPAGRTLGGVARRTRETMLVCEAAGYDVVIVETVGIGQSETAVADMVDFFICLMVPGAGDDLQGIKKGVLEIADLIAVNKADGDNLARARHAAADYRAALNIVTPENSFWRPPVLCISGLTGDGLDELWQQVTQHRQLAEETGELNERRSRQQVGWMWSLLNERLMSRFREHGDVAKALSDTENQVRQGILSPTLAAEQLLAIMGTGQP